MKKYLCIILVCLFTQQAWTQSGEGYDPENPGDPDVYYTLILEASPRSGGTVSSYNRQILSAGQSIDVNATPHLGYEFKRWMIGDSVVSNSSSFEFKMPAKDVVLIAYFEWNPTYDPENPDDPDAEGYSHKVSVYSNPSAGGYFNASTFTLIEGHTTHIYAYPHAGYRFESWSCNGEVVSTDNPLNIKMGSTDIAYTANFIYNPISPEEPSPNVFNAATGEMIIDNFTPGSLNDAIYTVTGSSENYALVHSITVIGSMQSSDFGFANNYRNCSLIDLSRTTGYTEVPDWSFEGLDALTKLVLPASVERMGNNVFIGCNNLSELYCYAITPPEVDENTFSGVESALIVKVPASSVSLYQKANGWKSFTIIPVDAETNNMVINLPADASDGRYKNMFIELENAISGQTYKYLITDRQSYTFANLIRNTSYNIYVKNAVGAVLGAREKVLLEEKDLTITFDALRQPQTLLATVLAPGGTDVTAQTTITWLNEDGSLLANGATVSGVLEGTNITYRIVLPQALAMQYKMPIDAVYTVKSSGNNISCQLQAFKEVSLSGRVLDVTTEKPISGAMVTISQLLNGKYTKSAITRTDNEGKFAINVLGEQSTLTISANNYLSQTLEYTNFSGNQQLEDFSLKAITGGFISVNFTYTESVEDGQIAETQGWYSDEANVTYSLYNQTQDKVINEFNVQNGSIVLLEDVAEDDVLLITAKSKTGMFRDVRVSATMDSRNRANITIPIVELGALKACYKENENNGVVGILYDANGVLLRKGTFNGDTLLVSNVVDGNYTLVVMGSSTFFNSVLNLSELANSGLSEGRDYIKNTVSISSGRITTLNIAQVPTFDESKFYYTGENTLFSANKSQVTIGNYITLRAKIDFKDQYAALVRDLKLIVDLPESCSFVENSVLTSTGVSGYELVNNRLAVNLSTQNDLVRFCVIPTIGGTCKPNAFVQFNYGGKTIMQPIGSAFFNAENLAISVPNPTADSVVVVNGTAQSDCVVKIYDGNVLIGQTHSLANGQWSAKVNLYKPYSHSFHDVYAEVETANGQSLLTDTKTVEFDKTITQLKTITMLYNGNTIVFDQIEGTTSASTYSYVPSVTDFTFIAKFTKNDTALIKNLEFKVLASDGTVRRVSSTYSERHNAWVGKATYDNSGKIPVNVSAEYTIIPVPLIDSLRIVNDRKSFQEMVFSNILNIDSTKFVVVNYSESMIVYQYQTQTMDSPIFVRQQLLNYDEWIDSVVNRESYLIESNGLFMHMSDNQTDDCYTCWVWTEKDKTLLQIDFSYNNKFTPVNNIQGIGRKRASTWWGTLVDGFIPLNIFGIKDIIDEYNRGFEEYQYWLRQYNTTLNNHYKIYQRTVELLNSRCEDGSLRLQPSIYELFEIFVSSDLTTANGMHAVFKNNLNRMESDLIGRRNVASALSALLSSANIIRKTQTIVQSLGDVVTNIWSKSIPNWVAEGIGGTVDAALDDRITELLDRLLYDWFTAEDMANWYYKENAKVIAAYSKTQNNIIKAYGKCPKKEEEEKEKDDDFNNKDLKPTVDPSGYVYEGVSSNRLQGVTATAYFMETTEDMYGVLHDEPRVWDAEEYAQENPLFTDENGMYQWDVPQGLWQVKFEKEGYETTYSEWLPVPPPQLEVNIGMVQARQPEVKGAHAYTDGVEVEFDKYMLPELLNTDNIMVSQNGTYVEGSVKLMNEEKAYMDENTTYASKVRFVPAKPFSAKEVTLYVNNKVKSYADIPMADSYSQTFDIEKEVKSLVVDSESNVPYTGKKEVSVYVLPADAAEGKKMRASSAAELIASLEQNEAVIDENGLAQFIVNGELPGSTGITFSIEGLDVTATTTVKVEMEEEGDPTIVPVPTASIAAGSSVYRGTEVTLSVNGENLKIWYTTDGSCPCDENGTRQVYSDPIAITGDMVIKAMAETTEGDGSDVATFTYSILRNNDGIVLNNGWTWTSFNMASDALVNVNTALASGAWTVNDEIKDNRYTDSYSANQRKWIGTLSKHGKLDNTGMFKIHSSQAQTLQLTGEAINPQTVSITVNPNWNYIAYLPMRNLSVAEALAGYAAQEGDVIKSQDAFAVYSARTGWQGDLTTMIVGQGYMLKRSASAARTTFRYPEGSTGSRAKKRQGQTHLYANNMNVIGRVMDVDTEKGDSLIAMVDGKVRGASVVQEHGKVFLTIQGDETENVELVLQRDGEQIAVANAPIRYENNDILGTLNVPTDIKFATATQEAEGITVSPCVVETFMTVSVNRTDVKSVSVAINSISGALVAESHLSALSGGKFEKTFNLSSLSAGVYLVTIRVNGQSNVVRIIKK